MPVWARTSSCKQDQDHESRHLPALPGSDRLPALAQPTHVMVRALALDAKFIGDHTGGADITLTDARTGKVLAREGRLAEPATQAGS